MAGVTVHDLAANVAAMLEKHLGVGGDGLEAKLKRAGRRLPAHVRRDGKLIVDALPLADSPKLARRINLPRLEAAERRMVAYLKNINRADRRKGAVLGLLGGLSFNLLALFALIVALLVWRGLV